VQAARALLRGSAALRSILEFALKVSHALGHLVAAFRAELGTGLDFRSAARAFVLWTKRLAALRAEFRSLGTGSAGGAQGGGLAGEVEIFRQILRADLFPHLLDGGLGLFGGEFDFEVGCAIETERSFCIPAGTDADPVRTFGALFEIRLGLVDRGAEGFVMRGTLNGAFDFVGGVAGLAEEPSEKAPGGAKRAARHSGNGRLELRHESVAAAVAEEFELESLVGGMVIVVSRELNESHGSSKESGNMALGEGRGVANRRF